MTSKTPETMTPGAEGLAVLAGVILLLEAAADRCLNFLAADPAPPGLEESFALSDLGLGARVAAIQACALLPADIELLDIQTAESRLDRDDPLELVCAAEALTRTVPIDSLPRGSSRVVVALCDLLREHG
ncbi:hypothetical protein [Humibacillus xanthopallidus]|uniref:Uncharacterized protein n=1 Tax=Humibacillus xanthopallidus TaxID=412689 RepID=A0A543HZL9_9MICO|nr:hypothetical protein [Humibacillus xanthopallidus]TQM63786.1 hypothetical protein FBY41_0138 [Humibacillus xanthopallidus]